MTARKWHAVRTSFVLVLLAFGCGAPTETTTSTQGTTASKRSPSPHTLAAWVDSISGGGRVVINGVDTSVVAGSGFTFLWGDGSSAVGWFPQAHVYANRNETYSAAVIAHYASADSDLVPVTVQFPTPGRASRLALGTQPSNTTPANAISPAVSVLVQDSLGNTDTSATNSVTVSITPGSGTSGAVLGGTLVHAASHGIATFADLTVDRAGNGYTLTATSQGLASATSAPFSVTTASSSPFDSLTYSPPVPFSYTARDGSSVTETVFPGQVVILVDSSLTPTAVAGLVQSAGGRIGAQVPASGVYVAIIAQAGEANGIATINAQHGVTDAFPNGAILARGGEACSPHAATLDKAASALVQTIDVPESRCGGLTTHQDAVATIAASGGVAVNINRGDVYLDPLATPEATYFSIAKALAPILESAQTNGAPVIVNISMGPGEQDGNLSQDAKDDQNFYGRLVEFLHAEARAFPGILDKTVLFVAGSDEPIDETASFRTVHSNPSDPVWNSLYFVESQEGAAALGCSRHGLGYTQASAPNVIAAKGCGVSIPGVSGCTFDGTSFATPAVANVVAQTFLGLGGTVPLSQVAAAVWSFQKANGRLPTTSDLLTTLTVSQTGSGSGTVATSPSGSTFLWGATVTLTATPNTGSTFTGWSGACSGTGQCTLVMNGNLTVIAAFSASALVTDAVTPSAVTLGSAGGCPGGQLTTTFHVAAANGVTWTAAIDPNTQSLGGTKFGLAGGSGSGSGDVVLTITVPTQTPSSSFSSCSLTYKLGTFTNVYVTFSDGTVIGVTAYWTFVGTT